MEVVEGFSERDVEKILKILPMPETISFGLPVPSNIERRIMTKWKGPTEDGTPYEASHSLIYKIRGLEREQIINAAKEVLFRKITGEDGDYLSLHYRDGTLIGLSKEDLHIASKHEPDYIGELLKFIKGRGGEKIKYEATIYALPFKK